MDIVISNIGQLITPLECGLGEAEGRYSLHVSHETTLYVHNGRMIAEPKGRARSEFHVVDARGGVVMPGLIDPFWVITNVPPWVSELPDAKRPAVDLLSWSMRMLRRAVNGGVTAVEVKCPYGDAFAGLDVVGGLKQHSPPRVIGTLLATLSDDGEACDRSVSSLIGEVIPEMRRRRLATFCDIGWGKHPDAMTEVRSVLRAASGAGLRPKLHIESTSRIDDVDRHALALDAVAVEGASYLPLNMAQQLAAGHVLPVYLPAMCEDLPARNMHARLLVDQGLPIAAGSGNGFHGRAPVSMWTVLACATNSMRLSLAEAIVACTLNNAMALEMSHEIGSLEPGKRADLIVLDLADYREIETAVDLPPITMVMVNGEVVRSA
jgi:imidazolonepropionase